MRRRIKENLKTNVKTNNSIGKEWAINNGYISPDEFKKQKANWETRFNKGQKEIDDAESRLKKIQVEYDKLKKVNTDQAHHKWAINNKWLSPEGRERLETKLNEVDKLRQNAEKEKDNIAMERDENLSKSIVGWIEEKGQRTYSLINNYEGLITQLPKLPNYFHGNSITTSNSFHIFLAGCTDAWFYMAPNFTGKCYHVHNGDKNVNHMIGYELQGVNQLPQSVIIRQNINSGDGAEYVQNWDMGNLKKFIGRVVSFISLGDQNYALDDTGEQRAGKGYHLWTFTANNANQQFKVLSTGQLQRVGTNLFISANPSTKKIIQKSSNIFYKDKEFDNNKDMIWKLNEQNQLVSAINEKMGIDISESKYRNQTPILYWELHEGNNQKWKPVSIEGFDSLFVGEANSLLTLIKLIGFILVFFCFICLLRAMRNDALHAQRTVSTDD